MTDKFTPSFPDSDMETEVQRFYRGKGVFITGGTGFMGKLLIEKLLRACPGIKTIFIMVRNKKGKDMATRIDEILDVPIFNQLKETQPNFNLKLVGVEGDCELDGLGLSAQDRLTLIEEVNIIFNCAASVNFKDRLQRALRVNVAASLEVLQLAKELRRLDVLMHVSTAYVNCHESVTEEVIYSNPGVYEKLCSIAEKLSEEQIKDISPPWYKPCYNTYIKTKSLAEYELKVRRGDIPLGFLRPAMVMPTYNEPIPGWIDNYYGPIYYTPMIMKGVLRTLRIDCEMAAPLVTADYTVNCLIVAAHSVHETFRNSSSSEPPVFNFKGSDENIIKISDFFSKSLHYIAKTPSSQALWYPFFIQHSSKLLDPVLHFLLHFLPAVIFDTFSICLGRKPTMLPVLKMMKKHIAILGCFVYNFSHFDPSNSNVVALWRQSSDADKQLFPFNMEFVDWDVYLESYVSGVRKYLLNESVDSLPQARIRHKRLYYIHEAMKVVVMTLAAYLLMRVILTVFS